jgi:hypothetical protein
MLPVYVRARDAGFYRNPVVDFPEGFLCFDDESPPELVLWLDEAGTCPEPLAVLKRRLGPAHGAFGIRAPKGAQRVVPGTNPPMFKPAAGFEIQLNRRIPQPRVHEGVERRTSRCGPCFVIDFPVHAMDAHELDVLD